MESAETISPFKRCATSRATALLPTAVGPTIANNFCIKLPGRAGAPRGEGRSSPLTLSSFVFRHSSFEGLMVALYFKPVHLDRFRFTYAGFLFSDSQLLLDGIYPFKVGQKKSGFSSGNNDHPIPFRIKMTWVRYFFRFPKYVNGVIELSEFRMVDGGKTIILKRR